MNSTANKQLYFEKSKYFQLKSNFFDKMQTTIGERLILLMRHFGDNQTQFALRTRNSAKNIHSAIKGIAKPGFDVIQNIVSNIEELNPRWLITGEGGMLKSQEKSDRFNNILEPEEKYFSSKNSNSPISVTEKDLLNALVQLKMCEMDKDLLKNENIVLRQQLEKSIRHQIKS